MLSILFLATLADVDKLDFLAARTVQDRFLDRGGQLLERRIEIEAVMRGETLQHLKIKLVALVPAANRAGTQRKMRVGDDALGIEEADVPEAVAARAGAHRIVERKKPRLEF